MKFKLLAIIAFLFIPLGSVSAEQITSFDSVIDISERGVLRVRERVVMDYGHENRHGIIRSLRQDIMRGDEEISVRITGMSVVDDEGAEIPFSFDRSDGFFDVKIGDDDEFVTGVVPYNISYFVDFAVDYDDAADILMWDPVGLQWSFPIDAAKVTYRFFKPIARNKLTFECVSGVVGSSDVCESAQLKDVGGGLVSELIFSQNDLVATQGMVSRVEFGKGYLKIPRPVETLLYRFVDNWYWLLGIIGICIALYVVRRRALTARAVNVDEVE